MTDETKTPTRRGGWPKGKPRKPLTAAAVATAMPMLAKMKARPNWDEDTFSPVGDDGGDRLHIPQDVVEALARDGVALQWVTRHVRGQEVPQELRKYTKGGWTPVHGGDFDGVLDGMFLPKGDTEVIGVEECMLVARPMALHQKARERDARAAEGPVKIQKQAVIDGINATGGSHPTALRGNKINREWERIQIPGDE